MFDYITARPVIVALFPALKQDSGRSLGMACIMSRPERHTARRFAMTACVSRRGLARDRDVDRRFVVEIEESVDVSPVPEAQVLWSSRGFETGMDVPFVP
jgi:hypothetical protein